MLRPLFIERDVDLHLVVGTPFLYVRSDSMLVMADLHLGFEEAASRGLTYSARGSTSGYVAIFLPRIQLKRALTLFSMVIENLTVKKVLVNGDIKHAFDRLLRQEREEIVEFVKYLRERGVEEIKVVRGNHDNFIKPLLKRLDVEFTSGVLLTHGGGRVLFVHGHEEPRGLDFDVVVIGHEHPSLRCFDVYRFPCLLKIPLQNGKVLVVMPATGPYHPGTLVTPNPQDYLSPIIRKLESLYSMSILIWIDLGEVTGRGVDYFEETIATELVKVDRYLLNSREIAVIEFKDYETAHLLCIT